MEIKKLWFGFLVIVLVMNLLITSCASSLYIKNGTDIKPQVQSAQLVNLREISYPSDGLNTRQKNQLMKTGFLETGTPEMGYYHIYVNSFQSGMSEIPYIHASTLGILIPLGVPTDTAYGWHDFTIDFYDSNGTWIKSYYDRLSVSTTRGLYYGGQSSVNRKLERDLSNFWTRFLRRINLDSEMLNVEFTKAGPINSENEPIALANINNFIQRTGSGGSRITGQSYVPPPTTPSAPSASSTSVSSSGSSGQQIEWLVTVTGYDPAKGYQMMTGQWNITASTQADATAEGRRRFLAEIPNATNVNAMALRAP